MIVRMQLSRLTSDVDALRVTLALIADKLQLPPGETGSSENAS